MADNSAEITEIETILNSGQTEISVDGLRTKVDFKELRKRLADLKATDGATQTAKMVRPVVSRIKIGNAW